MFQRRVPNLPRGQQPIPIVPIIGTPVLAQSAEGNNLSLTPVSTAAPDTISTFTLYINSTPVVGYVDVDLATLQGYVWQAADEWLDAYVDQTLTGPWIIGSPVTVSSNVVSFENLDNFILLIQTDLGFINGTSPATGTDSFRFYGVGTYDIDWGDGTIQNGVSGTQTRTYASVGTYRIRIRNWTGARYQPPSSNTDGVKILELQQWGTAAWISCSSMFRYCRRMIGTYYDAPNLTGTTTLQRMFENTDSFNGSPNASMSAWDVSGITSLSQMFFNAISFNQDLGAWVLNNSVLMSQMFTGCGVNTENYSRTLIGWANEWSATGDPTGRSLGATGMTYHNTVYGGAPYDNAVSARAALVGATPGGAGWTITGDALVP